MILIFELIIRDPKIPASTDNKEPKSKKQQKKKDKNSVGFTHYEYKIHTEAQATKEYYTLINKIAKETPPTETDLKNTTILTEIQMYFVNEKHLKKIFPKTSFHHQYALVAKN